MGAFTHKDRGVAVIKKSLSDMILHKKGFTYLLVTSLFVVVILMAFFTTSRYSYQDQESLQQVRIRAMNDFMKNLDLDMHRAAYIAAFRAMLALEDHVTTTGQYLPDVDESFRETFFYGTINGTESPIMTNSTFEDYLIKVRLLSQSIGVTLNINVTNISMNQSDPWSIDIYMLMNITASDDRNTAAWNIYKEYVTKVPIDNLRDPLYSKNTFNRVPNTIRRPLNDTLVDAGNDTMNLVTHIEGSYYIESAYAPNFIMRFEGDVDPDPNGIESVVNIRSLSDQEISVYEDRVKIDYIYFNNMATDKVCYIENVPANDYLIIPTNRISLYQIGGLNYSVSCP